MSKEIRETLIGIARSKSTWTYSQLNNQLQLGLNFENISDRDLIGDWLGDVSVHEHAKGRPLLSALITRKDRNREQGDGFYKLCEDLFNIDWEVLKADKNWENKMIADCYTFWTNADNYNKFKNDF